jgi:isocitrate dehydrogenase (NAD+)
VGHIGWPERQRKLEAALDICGQYEKKLTLTGRNSGCTGHDYAQYVMETLTTGDVEARLKEYQSK